MLFYLQTINSIGIKILYVNYIFQCIKINLQKLMHMLSRLYIEPFEKCSGIYKVSFNILYNSLKHTAYILQNKVLFVCKWNVFIYIFNVAI